MQETPTLRPYQWEGAFFLASAGKAMLADEPGLGKTAQAITAAAMATQHLDREVTVAVVCPASVREVWRREVQTWWPVTAPSLRLLIDSYDRVALGHWDGLESRIDVLIADEAHYLKTPTSKRTKVFYKDIAPQAEHVFLLTGTPAPNHHAEMWTHLRYLAPTTLARKNGTPMPYGAFTARYCVTREAYIGRPQIVGSKNTEELRARVSPFMLRRRKEDVLPEMPPVGFYDLPLAMPASDEAAELKEMFSGEEAAVLEAAFAEGPQALRRSESHNATLRKLAGMVCAQALTPLLLEEIKSTSAKYIVFGYHKMVIEHIRAHLARTLPQGTVVQLTGETPQAQRVRAIDRFQNDPDCRVFLGQIQAAGTGITLTAATEVLFAEYSWVPSDNAQAAMRAHRLGQENPVRVRFASIAGTIHDRITSEYRRKAAEISEFLD